MTEQFLDSELHLAYTEIMVATCPADVFGSPTTLLPLTKQQAVIKNRFESLTKIVDSDRYTRVVDVNAANDAMSTLQRLYDAAVQELVEGVAAMEFTFRNTTYHVGERIAVGDNAVIYRAVATKGDVDDEVVLKIAHSKTGSTTLLKEAEYLRSFHSAQGRNPIIHVTRTLPKIKDTFSVEGRRVNVLPYYHGRKNLREIVEHFDHCVPVGHAAWIARRVLALPITASLAGLAHEAITPEHVLVHPITHEPIYLGWGHVIPHTETYRSSDIAATGRLIWYLFGDPKQKTWNPDTPETLRSMIMSLTSESDGNTSIDLSQFFTDFTQAIYASLGKKYRPLHLN